MVICMNILYIGFKDEYDADVLISLAKKNYVSVLSNKDCTIETGCEFIMTDSFFDRENFNDSFDVMIIKSNLFSIEEIGTLFENGAYRGIKRVIVVNEMDIFNKSDDKIYLTKCLADKYYNNFSLKSVIINTPKIYGHKPPKELINLCSQAITKNRIDIPSSENGIVNLIDINDFCVFFSELTSSFEIFDEKQCLELRSYYPFEVSRLSEKLKKRYNNIEISFTELDDTPNYQNNELLSVKSKNPLDVIDELLAAAEKEVYTNGALKRKRRGNKAVNLAIMLFFFAIVACWTIAAPPYAEFQFIDVRLILLVFTSIILGKNYGYLSAGLCGVIFIIEKLADGNAWYTLFYNVNNWITVVVYIACAMVLGMVLNKSEYREK